MQATVSKVNSVYCVVLHRLPICKSESIDLLPSKLITGIRSLGPNKGVDTKPISKPAWGKIDMIYIFFKLVYGFSKYAQSWGKETFHGQSLTYRKWRSVILLLSFFNLLYPEIFKYTNQRCCPVYIQFHLFCVFWNRAARTQKNRYCIIKPKNVTEGKKCQ